MKKVKQKVKQLGNSSGEPHRNRTCNLLIKSLTNGVPKSAFTLKLEQVCQLIKNLF